VASYLAGSLPNAQTNDNKVLVCTFTVRNAIPYPTQFCCFVNAQSPLAYASWADELLLQALLADDRGAFAELYERYWQRVFALAYRRLKSREIAEELVQDLFAALWHKRAQLSIQNLEHYLLAAISRRVIDYLRAHQVRTAYADYCRWQQAEATAETEETLAAADLTEAFARALLHLPEQSREIVRLSRLEHFSVPEIALRLNLSSKAVEYHLTKALRLLRGHLRDFVVAILLFFIYQNT
jgi:RNA polymerase sigma-70 factor (family 1)